MQRIHGVAKLFQVCVDFHRLVRAAGQDFIVDGRIVVMQGNIDAVQQDSKGRQVERMQEQAVGGHVDIFLIRPDELQIVNQAGVQGRFSAQNQDCGKVLLGYRGNGQFRGRFVRGRRVAAPLNAERTGGVALVRDFYIQTVAVAAGAGVFRTDHVRFPPRLHIDGRGLVPTGCSRDR